MHTAPNGASIGSPDRKRAASPLVKSSILAQIEIFKQKVSDWLKSLECNVAQKQALFAFLGSTKIKLTKKDIPELGCSIVRLKNSAGVDIFRIISHIELGFPGSFARAKFALPLSFSGKIIEVNLEVSIALKIIRHQNYQQDDYAQRHQGMHEFLSRFYSEGDIYGSATCQSASLKSRYAKHLPAALSGSGELAKHDSVMSELASDKKHYISLPFFAGITLFDYINKLLASNQKISAHDGLIIIFGLLDEMERLHQLGIVHRDIKPENIIFNEETQKVSLIDFDSAVKEKNYYPLFYTPTYWHADKIDEAVNRPPPEEGLDWVTIYQDIYAFTRVMQDLLHIIDPNEHALIRRINSYVNGVIHQKRSLNLIAVKSQLNVLRASFSQRPEETPFKDQDRVNIGLAAKRSRQDLF
jgi:serine/threonine protein kinase